jgi:hypothetical protein
MRAYESSYAMGGRPTSQIISHRSASGVDWEDGCVLTPEGMVAVLISPIDGYTRFDAVVNGRHHMRTEYRVLTRRGAAAVARRWLRGLTESA